MGPLCRLIRPFNSSANFANYTLHWCEPISFSVYPRLAINPLRWFPISNGTTSTRTRIKYQEENIDHVIFRETLCLLLRKWNKVVPEVQVQLSFLAYDVAGESKCRNIWSQWMKEYPTPFVFHFLRMPFSAIWKSNFYRETRIHASNNLHIARTDCRISSANVSFARLSNNEIRDQYHRIVGICVDVAHEIE